MGRRSTGRFERAVFHPGAAAPIPLLRSGLICVWVHGSLPARTTGREPDLRHCPSEGSPGENGTADPARRRNGLERKVSRLRPGAGLENPHANDEWIVWIPSPTIGVARS